MTFATLKDTLGREPITVVEMDLDFCNLTYGVSPCTAAVGVTGSTKCYNTFQTCQDRDNYDLGTKTYRFATANANLPVGENLFACVTNVSHVPTKIDVNGLSVRATIKIEMMDFPHHDRGIDPYTDDRAFNPEEQGTFWGKFKARNPFVVDRTIRVKYGFIDPAGFDTTYSTDFETREYVIEKIDGPDENGRVTITAKDILKLANNQKAKAPVQSLGVLSAGITAGATTIGLDTVSGYPTGGGLVRIGDELITYTGISSLNLTGCVRGTNNTTAVSHDADDGVQLCLQYTAEPVQSIIEDLLINFAAVSPSFVPIADWNAEAFLDPYDFTTIITTPTGVQDLLQELTQQSNSNLWWDDRDQEIKLKAIRTPLPNEVTEVVNMDNLIGKGVKVIERRDLRVSRVTIHYGVFDFTQDLTEFSNYRKHITDIDTDSESANEYGSIKEKEIFSRWIPSDSIASDLSTRIINRLKNTPKEITFTVDAKDSGIKTGDPVYVVTRQIQDELGVDKNTLYIVTEEKKLKEGSKSMYKATEFNTGITGGTVGLIGPNTLLDFTLESDANKATYAFISNNSGLMSDGSPGYRIV
jgi:hypothetical protein